MDAALEELESEGWIRREGMVIWAVWQLHMDPILNVNNDKHRKSVQNYIDALPGTNITEAFREKYPAWCAIPSPSESQENAEAIPSDNHRDGKAAASLSERREKGEGSKGKPTTDNGSSVGTGASKNDARVSSRGASDPPFGYDATPLPSMR